MPEESNIILPGKWFEKSRQYFYQGIREIFSKITASEAKNLFQGYHIRIGHIPLGILHEEDAHVILRMIQWLYHGPIVGGQIHLKPHHPLRCLPVKEIQQIPILIPGHVTTTCCHGHIRIIIQTDQLLAGALHIVVVIA